MLNPKTNEHELKDTDAWSELPQERKDALDDFYESCWRNPDNYKLDGCL